ncbi:GNAT family N-acetyltransferase [Salinivibrio sp. VYel1]|uniref:GNAT family N-acetyltransferase n=1 Tax=Salinivibrio sp. VYel1 TaxID=2490490 RepID=UPI00128BFEFE|nr:GNAT family N-acetyltransferase [Salinivibrio sp. VYel1]MPX91509.1 GNAT family N-acetyltransferase [Salinivibrio sp. VYel1]
MQVRRASVEDLDAIFALNVQIGDMHHQHAPHLFATPGPSGRAFLQKALQEADKYFWVAEHQNKVIGFLSARLESFEHIPHLVDDPMCHVNTIVVDRDARGTGAGKALMAACTQWAKDNHATVIKLEVMTFNQDAQAFYHALGFTPDSITMMQTLNCEPEEPAQ